MNLEARVQNAGHASGHAAEERARQRCHQRIVSVDDHDGGNGGAQGNRTIRRDVRKIENTERDVDAQRQQGKNQSDRERSDQEAHTASFRMSFSGPTQSAPRKKALSPAPEISRPSCNR